MRSEAPAPRPRSPLWIIVLALACEEPMHPYRMQTLIKQRGKDQVANVAQRNSVYQTIEALKRTGLIVVKETSRQEHRPERTVYEATDLGRHALQSWVRHGLATPAREFPEFPAVLSVLYGVRSTEDLASLLQTRMATLEARWAELQKPAPGIPRVFLLESEYAAALVKAEIGWLRGVIADVRGGRLTFPTVEEMLGIGEPSGAPSENAIRRMAAELGSPEETPRRVERTRSSTRKPRVRSRR
jgi:DNA-binding PadR family transcriptional regulator